jgi:hypothetical protein
MESGLALLYEVEQPVRLEPLAEPDSGAAQPAEASLRRTEQDGR